MHEACGVRECEGARDLDDRPRTIRDAHVAFVERIAQRPPAHELHHQECAAVVGLSDVVHAHDAGVLERRRRSGFAHQPLARDRVADRSGRQHLHRHGAAELLVFGAHDDAHPARADLLLDGVASSEPLAPTDPHGQTIDRGASSCQCGRAMARCGD